MPQDSDRYSGLLPSQESKDGVEEDNAAVAVVDEGDPVDIDEDVYGAAIFSITFDFYEVLTGKDHDGLGIGVNIYRILFVLFLLLCNYVLQLGMLGWVYLYVALPAVHDAQTVYRDYHAEVFAKQDDGSLAWSKERWDKWSSTDALCGLAFANFWFMYAILCLWWVLMLTEVRKTERLWRKFKQLPHAQSAQETMVLSTSDDAPNCVVKLTWQSRLALYLFLLLPKLLIAVVLTVVGTVWLTASGSFSDLILNSVALEFVIAIDEILFEGLLPESIKKDIENTKLVMPKPKKSGDEKEDARKKEEQIKAGFTRSTGYVAVIMVGVFLFLTYGQHVPVIGVFPGYLDDAQCGAWWRTKTTEICEVGKECFPIIDNR